MWRAHDTRRTDHAPVPRRQTERRGNLPYGCSVQSGGDWGARINTRADGRNDGNYISVTSPFVPDPNKMIAMANARQSSQYSSSARPDVSFAADKCLTDSDAYESMCITLAESQPWWAASTADNALYDITAIVVRNRADFGWDRFQGYVVTVDGAECARGDANGKQGYLEIACNKRGRTVRLQLLMQGNNYLNLQYIGVKGTKAP